MRRKDIIENCVQRKVQAGADRNEAEKECTQKYEEIKSQIEKKKKLLSDNEIIFK